MPRLHAASLALALFIGGFAWAQHDGAKAPGITVNPYGKFFADRDDDLQIEMALIEGKNANGLQDVLLKITGAAAYTEGIDGKVLRYTAVAAGTGTNFEFTENGKTFTRMTTREGSFEVFVADKTFKVFADGTKAKEVRPLHLLTAYKKSRE